MARRANNEGTIYKDDKLNRFVGQFRYVDPVTGEKKRKKITRVKKADVVAAGKAFYEENKRELETKANIANFTSLENYMRNWLENTVKPTVRKKTYERYECNFRCHIVPGIGCKNINEINRAMLQDFFADLKRTDGKPMAARTANSIRGLLKSVFDAAVADDIVMKNPVDITKPKKTEKTAISIFSESQYKSLLSVARLHSIKAYLVIRIAFATGFRIGEIFGLEYSDIDFQANTLRVRQTVVSTRHGKMLQHLAKNNSSLRTIKVEKALIEELAKFKEIHDLEKRLNEKNGYTMNNDFIVENRDGSFCDPAYFSDKIFKRQLLRDAKIPKVFRMHDCRHTHATWLLEKGVNIKVVSERLGHKSIRITLDIYSHITKTMQEQAVEALEGIL